MRLYVYVPEIERDAGCGGQATGTLGTSYAKEDLSTRENPSGARGTAQQAFSWGVERGKGKGNKYTYGGTPMGKSLRPCNGAA